VSSSEQLAHESVELLGGVSRKVGGFEQTFNVGREVAAGATMKRGGDCPLGLH
jgi:hypothetical protein